MLIQLVIITFWILLTLTFYLAVGLACRRLRPSPIMVATYAAVRSRVSNGRWWMWYTCLFAGTIASSSLALGLGIVLSRTGSARDVGSAVTACVAAGYAVTALWPRRIHPTRLRASMERLASVVCAVALGSVLLFALLSWPNRLVTGIGTYALCVPPLIWFRALRIRTAACLLMATAFYDAIHVYGTGWMITFVHNIIGTPFVLEIPGAFHLGGPLLFSIGQGDILAPGLLVVVAARAADPHKASWLVTGSLVGAAAGLAITTAITITTQQPLPALIILGPCSCLGYAAALAASHFAGRIRPVLAF